LFAVACTDKAHSTDDVSPDDYPDAGCAGPDFPAVGTDPVQTVPCDCAHAAAPSGDDLATARMTLIPCTQRPQAFQCGSLYGFSNTVVDTGGIEFYDGMSGRPMGAFFYGNRDTCVAYDPSFTGLPTPCQSLPVDCRQDDGGVAEGGAMP
jgi:hypothetical protein